MTEWTIRESYLSIKLTPDAEPTGEYSRWPNKLSYNGDGDKMVFSTIYPIHGAKMSTRSFKQYAYDMPVIRRVDGEPGSPYGRFEVILKRWLTRNPYSARARDTTTYQRTWSNPHATATLTNLRQQVATLALLDGEKAKAEQAAHEHAIKRLETALAVQAVAELVSEENTRTAQGTLVCELQEPVTRSLLTETDEVIAGINSQTGQLIKFERP